MTIFQSNPLLKTPTGALQIPVKPDADSGDIEIGYLPRQGLETVELSLVIPTYNESKNIPHLLEILTGLLDGQDYELIVVDDDSPDRTWEVAQDLMSVYPRLRVMRRQQEKGLASAVIRGWQASRGDILAVIDGDLQHPPHILLNLLTAIQTGADLALASRHVEGGGVSQWSLTRRFLSRGAQILGLIILPQVVGRISDPMSGFFMVRRYAIAGPVLHPTGYKILLEVIGRGRVDKIAEVGYVFQERVEGESKVTWHQYVEYFIHLLRLRSRGRFGRISKKFQFPFDRFLRFATVGFSGVFVDMTVFYLLTDPNSLGWGLTRSKILAAEVAIINNFILNDSWTFGDISQTQQGWNNRLKRFFKFNLICLGGLILNVLLLNTFFNVFGIDRYVANLMAIALVTVWNFWFNLKLSWRVTDVKNK
ncbi:MAG: Undecaprenyl-phosphate 4-deoxy-4-formamido-L-arabinose transferase [Chroococcopsis gigantea SAG 12.99]|nr:glycosyltransferase [Chlorogloea purpurea SAG 13.99]MDV3002144.1 Undecaprenyl-phosphate 4-deoxy-4-formamido-L-arabinose transferase [Chroococcopsis gigantea SAG 12.99]